MLQCQQHSFSRILCYRTFMATGVKKYFLHKMMSCAVPYDIIYHPFPFNSKYLKMWRVDSPAFRYLKGPLIKFSGTEMKGVPFLSKNSTSRK